MPYEASLDECQFTKSYETESQKISVSVYPYNKGQKKLQISRETKDKQDEFKFAKLGRLTKEEAKNILPLIQEALANME
jgi:uncharacterized lipoprotein YehR (DUF1307 family)